MAAILLKSLIVPVNTFNFNSSPPSATHILVDFVIIGLCNGLSLAWHQTIIKTSDDFSSITPQRTDFNEKNGRN